MFKHFFLLLFVLIQSTFLFAQNFKHPYSHYGIGILEDQSFSQNAEMGGLTLTQKDDRSFNPWNPASYSYLKATSFDVGIKGRIYNLKQNDISYTSNLISFGYFALGFPINRKHGWSASFGMLPVSKIGYNAMFDTLIMPDSLQRKEVIDNSGGFNRAFLGSSILLFDKLSIGANVYYMFGNTQLYHSVYFEDNYDYFGVITQHKNYYGTAGFDFGLQFNTKIGDNLHFGLGTSFSPTVQLKLIDENRILTFQNSSSSFIYKDTIYYEALDMDSKSLPYKFGVGLTIYYPNKWKVGIEYRVEQWSDFQHTDTSIKLNNLQEFCVGWEYTPDRTDILNYYKRITYRVGIKYAFSYLNIVKEFNQLPEVMYNPIKTAFTLGAEFPINKSLSAINAGVEFGRIGILEGDLVRELYVNIYLGFRLNDIWFRKSKID